MKQRVELKRGPQASIPTMKRNRDVPDRDGLMSARYWINNQAPTTYEVMLAESIWNVDKSQIFNTVMFPKNVPQKPTINLSPRMIKQFNAPGLPDDFCVQPMYWSENGHVYLASDTYVLDYHCVGRSLSKLKMHSDEILSPYMGINTLCDLGGKLLLSGHSSDSLVTRVALFDLVTEQREKEYLVDHTSQYNAMSSYDPNVFYAGSDDGILSIFDARRREPLRHHLISANGSISSLSVNGTKVAVGSVNLGVFVVDVRNPAIPITNGRCNHYKFEVKALEFSPYNKSLIAIAGHQYDKNIIIFNVDTGKVNLKHDNNGGISNIHWINENQLATVHSHSGIKCWAIEKNKLYQYKDDILKKNTGKVLKEPDPKGLMYFSTQNPKNRYEFFTGTNEKQVAHWDVNLNKDEVEDKPSILSLRHPRNMIR